MKFVIDFGAGAGLIVEIEGTLEDAKAEALERMAYTQRDIEIKDENGEVITASKWWGYDPDVEQTEEWEILERFHTFGFYGTWSDEVDGNN